MNRQLDLTEVSDQSRELSKRLIPSFFGTNIVQIWDGKEIHEIVPLLRIYYSVNQDSGYRNTGPSIKFIR